MRRKIAHGAQRRFTDKAVAMGWPTVTLGPSPVLVVLEGQRDLDHRPFADEPLVDSR